VRAAWQVAAEVKHRLEQWKQEQAEAAPGKTTAIDPSAAAFGRFFKVRVSAQVKRIRGKLNVPRERFWLTEAGAYRIAQFQWVAHQAR
jgi:hypothetical protein